jgi:MoxR-like ATPase
LTSTLDKFLQLEAELNTELFERKREIHGALVALIARKHYLMVGAPGIGKSFLVRRLAARVDFGDENAYFQWLLTKYTVPEEIFGPPSLQALREGRYVRNTTGKLPEAHLAFLDEYRRGNSSILNALLTIMNERLFFNDDTHVEVPLDVVFGGTNTFEPDDDLHAIDDRWHLRYEMLELQESGSVSALLTHRFVEPQTILTYAEVQEAQEQASLIPVGSDITDALVELRDKLKAQGVEPSDRRLRECLPILQAEAWLNGRDRVETPDLRILRSVLWSRLQEQNIVTKIVYEQVNPLDREAHELLEGIQKLQAEFDKGKKAADGPTQMANIAVEVYAKMAAAKKSMEDLKRRNADSGRESEVLEIVEERFRKLAKELARDGFGHSKEELG